jgi:hypothetical protein
MTPASHSKPARARSRILFSSLLLVFVLLGLASRSSAADTLPEVVRDYSGDVLWALMVYLLFAAVLPKHAASHIALIAMTFATGIEVSQLFRPDWLETIRNLPGMRLIFGYSFLWSDLLCYAFGITIGWLGEVTVNRIGTQK